MIAVITVCVKSELITRKVQFNTEEPEAINMSSTYRTGKIHGTTAVRKQNNPSSFNKTES